MKTDPDRTVWIFLRCGLTQTVLFHPVGHEDCLCWTRLILLRIWNLNPHPPTRGSARCQGGRSRKRGSVGPSCLRLLCLSFSVVGSSGSCLFFYPQHRGGSLVSRTDGPGGYKPGSARLLFLPPPWKNPDGGPQCALNLPQASGPDPAILSENGRIHRQFRWVPGAARPHATPRHLPVQRRDGGSRTRRWRLYTCHCCIYLHRPSGGRSDLKLSAPPELRPGPPYTKTMIY